MRVRLEGAAGCGALTIAVLDIRVFPDQAALASAAARVIADRLESGGGDVGIAGGGTPRAAYRALASLPLDWHRISGWMTDERHVPLDHPDSNAGMARAAWFDRVSATLHPVPWMESAPEAATAYEALLARLLPAGAAGPEPSLVILGLGADGHTASLFAECPPPGPGRDFVAVAVPERGWRLTASYALLARAQHTVFLACGEHKAAALAAVMSGDSPLPAARVARLSRDPVWLVDRDAAALL